MRSSALSANVALIRARAAAHPQARPQFGRGKKNAFAPATTQPSYGARAAAIVSASALMWIGIALAVALFRY